MSARSSKRRRLSKSTVNINTDSDSDLCEISATAWDQVARCGDIKKRQTSSNDSISPPPLTRDAIKQSQMPILTGTAKTSQVRLIEAPRIMSLPIQDDTSSQQHLIQSPIQLSTVNGLAASSNDDTVSLGDILGDPLIKECWLFNYLFDVDFIMYPLASSTDKL